MSPKSVQPIVVEKTIVIRQQETKSRTVYYGPSTLEWREDREPTEQAAASVLLRQLIEESSCYGRRYELLQEGLSFLVENASDPEVRARAAACIANLQPGPECTPLPAPKAPPPRKTFWSWLRFRQPG
jgi:hypothetical protein